MHLLVTIKRRIGKDKDIDLDQTMCQFLIIEKPDFSIFKPFSAPKPSPTVVAKVDVDLLVKCLRNG
jgi:hypothetical protein